jgi:hypothetical protein
VTATRKNTEGRASPTLFVDADACPVTSVAITIARAHGLPVVLVSNASQNLGRHAARPGVEAVQVGSGRDAADFAIITRLHPGDVVITGDLGVAAMALGRGARVLGFRGREHTADTIDLEMALRHAEQKHRRAGGRTRGPDPLTDEHRENFAAALERLLDSHPQR